MNDINRIRCYSELSAKEQEIVDKHMILLCSDKAVVVMNFGTDDMRIATSLSEKALKNKVSQTDFSTFNMYMAQFEKEMESVNPKNLSKIEKIWMTKIPFFGSRYKEVVQERVRDTVSRYANMQSLIEDMMSIAERIRFACIADIKTIEKMEEDLNLQITNFELRCIAIEEAEKKLNQKMSEMQNSPDGIDTSETFNIFTLDMCIKRLANKKQAFTMFFRTLCQDVAKLEFLKESDIKVKKQIDDIKKDLLPVWKESLATSIIMYRSNNSTYMIGRTAEVVEQLSKICNRFYSEDLFSTDKKMRNRLGTVQSLENVSESLKSEFRKFEELQKQARNARANAVEAISTRNKLSNEN